MMGFIGKLLCKLGFHSPMFSLYLQFTHITGKRWDKETVIFETVCLRCGEKIVPPFKRSYNFREEKVKIKK